MADDAGFSGANQYIYIYLLSGFLKWMVYNGNSENQLGDLEVTPISENPPYYNIYIYPVILYVHTYIIL